MAWWELLIVSASALMANFFLFSARSCILYAVTVSAVMVAMMVPIVPTLLMQLVAMLLLSASLIFLLAIVGVVRIPHKLRGTDRFLK